MPNGLPEFRLLTDIYLIVNNVKYYADNYIYVANDQSIKKKEPSQGDKGPDDAATPIQRRETEWVGRILEIRARDEHHVFARIYWMYWPDELPARVRDRKRIVGGRQPYHGQGELVASNHSEWHCQGEILSVC